MLAPGEGVRYTMLMATTKKATVKKTAASTTKKPTAKKTTSSTARKQTVDYYPNRMGFAVASLAAVTLVLLGLIAVTN